LDVTVEEIEGLKTAKIWLFRTVPVCKIAYYKYNNIRGNTGDNMYISKTRNLSKQIELLERITET
jgi:hypothetical protein